jgi:tetratricopeptide (TPR) repeat protein
MAAREAEAVAAWDEAARWHRQALALLSETATDASRVSEGTFLTALGRCLRYAGQRNEARETLQRALAIHRERRDGQSAALTTLELITTKFGVGTPAAERPILIDQALELLAADHPHLRARLLVARAFGFFGEPDATGAIDEAAAIAAQYGYEDIAAHVLDHEMHLAWTQLRLADGRAIAERSFEAFDRLGLFAEAFHQLDDITQMMLDEGLLDAAVAAAERGLTYARKYHLAQEQQNCRMAFAIEALLRSDRTRFEAFLSEVVTEWDYHPRMLQAIAAELDGDLGRAATLVPDSAEFRPNEASTHGARARCLLELGDKDAAQRELVAWEETLNAARFVGGARQNAYGHVDDALTLGSDALVKRAYVDLIEAEVVRVSFGAARGLDRLRGLAALHLGLVDEADKWYSRGLEWSKRERCPVEAGRCHQGLAAVAEARGDKALAMQHLDAAGELFAEYGAKLYLDQVLAKKQFLKA